MMFAHGMQQGPDPHYLRVVSTGKHFLDYDQEGNPQGTQRDSFTAEVTDKDQVEFYLPAWRAASQGARIRSVMCAYNAVGRPGMPDDAVPSCGSSLFQNHVLRGEFDFRGYVVSDCDSIGDPAFERYVNKTHPKGPLGLTRVNVGLTGGCDLNCGGTYGKYLFDSLQANITKERTLTNAVARVFTAGIELGLLDANETVSYSRLGPADIDKPEHRALAKSAAEQAMVLLKNQGGLLPLHPDKSVAILGPHFNSTVEFQSIYFGDNKIISTQSPIEALRGTDRGLPRGGGSEISGTCREN